MATMDIFEGDAFSIIELTRALENIPYKPATLSGSGLFGPRGVPHGYEVGPDGVRMLFALTPGGFEDVVRAMSVPADERRLPDHTCEPPDPEAAYALVTARGLELVDA